MQTGKIHRPVLGLIVAVYLAMAILSASTLLPGCDEAWFTLPGYNLVVNGHFGTTVLDETARFRQVRLDGINERTYWIMPAYPLLQGLVGGVTGFGLMTTRSVSIFFGLIAIIAVYGFAVKLSNDITTALLAAGLTAVDQYFLFAAGFGRMDMMTFALGMGSLAVFLSLRERRLTWSVGLGFAMAAVAFFAHPLGLMWAVSLALLVVYFDRSRLRLVHLAAAAAPFVLAAAAWGIYIAQDPALFRIQFGGNASDRWAFFASPIAEISREISVRYFSNFGLGEGLSRIGQIRAIPLAVYAVAVLCAISIKGLRSQSFVRVLLILGLQQFVMIMLLDSLKQAYYLLHIVPTLILITAAVARWTTGRGLFARAAAVTACLSVLMVNGVTDTVRFRRDHVHQNFLRASAVLNQETGEHETVMASAEFWFAMERPDRLIDDFRLGVVSGKRADLIVLDEQRYSDWIKNLASSEPDIHRTIISMIETEYTSIYRDDQYEILRRRY